jgi:hypothetical protein
MLEAIKEYFNIGKIGRPAWLDETDAQRRAVGYCLEEMKFYEDWGRHNRIHWKIWQNTAIISGVLATTLAVIPEEHFHSVFLAGLARVVPTALTALAATVLSVYNYKGEHVRQGMTHDALQGELAKFLGEAPPYGGTSENKKVGQFIGSIRAIVSGELAAWRDAQQKPEEERTKPASQRDARPRSDNAGTTDP